MSILSQPCKIPYSAIVKLLTDLPETGNKIFKHTVDLPRSEDLKKLEEKMFSL